MSKYKLNSKLKQISSEEIFSLLLSSIKIGQSYQTLSGIEKHEVTKIEGEITIKRLGAKNTPTISFNELIDVISLFKSGKAYNTSSEEYKLLLLTRRK